MSQLTTGIETPDGTGSVEALALFIANMQRVDALMYQEMDFFFFGPVQAGPIFGKHVFAYDVYVEAATFNAYAGAPGGQAVICKVKVAGTAATKDFTLAATNAYAKDTPTNPTDILVTAGQTLEVYFSQVGNAAPGPGTNIKVTLQLRKRKL